MTTQIATFANGCFWCTEAIFQRLRGVVFVKSGYTGGITANPTYEQVCSGETGHAESLQIEFDPQIISYRTLLDIFWHTHNPTTLNRQGNDVGTQYRSEIFYADEEQKQLAEESKKELQKSGEFSDSIVTKIEKLGNFYPAESYHQNYYNHNSHAPYCQFVISPKVHKLLKKYEDKIKEEFK